MALIRIQIMSFEQKRECKPLWSLGEANAIDVSPHLHTTFQAMIAPDANEEAVHALLTSSASPCYIIPNEEEAHKYVLDTVLLARKNRLMWLTSPDPTQRAIAENLHEGFDEQAYPT